MTQSLIPCSVLVLTRNSEGTIRRCLDALKSFAQVIVQDGGSSDDTLKIAADYANVLITDQNSAYLNEEGRIMDFAAVRNDGLSMAKQEWVFQVDADEIPSEDLVQEILSVIEVGQPGVFNISRRFSVNGRLIAYASVYPALQIRFFHRSLVTGYQKSIHERIAVRSGVTPGKLTAHLIAPLPPAKEVWPKYRRYLMMELARSQTMTIRSWVKWVLLRNLRTMVGYGLRLIRIWGWPRQGAKLPIVYEMQFFAYAFLSIVYLFPPLRIMRRVPRFHQFLLYLFTGGSAAAIDIGLFFMLHRLGFFYITASVISGVIGFISAFLLHKYIAFQKHEKIGNHFVRYCILGLLNLCAMTFILYVCVQYLHIPKDIAKIISNASVVLWNFFLYKFLVYV